jgi:DNA-binding transcriptional MerR regulator
MKKINKRKSYGNVNYMNLVSKYNDKSEQINLENLSPIDKEEIERRLKEIDFKIEDIGKICDKKKQKSYEDYNNILKSNKSQFLDELTKLNFKLIETIKQNTREDFLQKLRKDLNSIKNQVYDKDKELQGRKN